MAEISENTEDTQALGEVERLEDAMVGDPPAAKGGRSRKPTDQPWTGDGNGFGGQGNRWDGARAHGRV